MNYHSYFCAGLDPFMDADFIEWLAKSNATQKRAFVDHIACDLIRWNAMSGKPPLVAER